MCIYIYIYIDKREKQKSVARVSMTYDRTSANRRRRVSSARKMSKRLGSVFARRATSRAREIRRSWAKSREARRFTRRASAPDRPFYYVNYVLWFYGARHFAPSRKYYTSAAFRSVTQAAKFNVGRNGDELNRRA